MSSNRCKTTCCGAELDEDMIRRSDELLTFEAYVQSPGVRYRAPDGYIEHYCYRHAECRVCGCQFAVWYEFRMGKWVAMGSSYWHSFSDDGPYEPGADGVLVNVVDLVEAMRVGGTFDVAHGMQVYGIAWEGDVPRIVRGRVAYFADDPANKHDVSLETTDGVVVVARQWTCLTWAEARLKLVERRSDALKTMVEALLNIGGVDDGRFWRGWAEFKRAREKARQESTFIATGGPARVAEWTEKAGR